MGKTVRPSARRCLFIVALLLAVPVAGQNGDGNKLRLQRWRMIDLYHFSSGVAVEHNANTIVAPRVSLGMGSFRNLLNADIGVGYEIVNPLPRKGMEGLGLHRVAPFVSVTTNIIRWRRGSIYLGGDMAYLLNVRTRHRLPDGLSLHDPDIAQFHFSVSAKCGLRLDYWDFSLYYSYDLSPAFGQKHIYETTGYDFYALEPSIYERSRIGIRVTYHLTLRPQ